VLANRGGLIAFDVGVGKTYTGIAVLAQARQDGWCRRPEVGGGHPAGPPGLPDRRRRLEEEGRSTRGTQGLRHL
jgi:hypothetical protein